MSLEDFEVAPEYQALSSNAFRRGRFANAHVLRALSRSANQLVLEGEPFLSLSWDSRRSTDLEVDEKAVRAVCSPYWTRMLPGVHLCTKIPGLTQATFIIHAEITAGARVFLQVETINAALDLVSDRPSGRVFELIGTGAEERYTLTNVPISPGEYERIGFWVRGERTDIEGDVGDHGSPSRGSVVRIESGALYPNSSTSWNTDVFSDRWSLDHVVVIHDSDDPDVMGPQLYSSQIIGVERRDTADVQVRVLMLHRPPSSDQEALAYAGRAYRIFELPKMRLFTIDALEQDSNGDGMRPTRKIYHHPRAPHVGYVLGNALRNIQTVQRYRGRMLVQKSWVRNLERPHLPGFFWDSEEIISAVEPETFFLWHTDLRRHPDEVEAVPRGRTVAHVSFTVLTELATRATIFFEITDGATTETETVEIVLGADAETRIPIGSGSPFESRSSSYEAIVPLVFEGEGPRQLRLAGFAAHDDTDTPPNALADSMRVDAVDIWTDQLSPPTTLSHLQFVSPNGVIAEEAAQVVEAGHFAACTTFVHYCGGFGAKYNFLDNSFEQKSGDKIMFDAALNTWEQRAGDHTIKVGKNVFSLRFLARCLVAAGETVEVRVLFDGTVRATLAFSDADNGAPVQDQILVSTLGGPAIYAIGVEIRRTSGGTTNNLILWSLDGEARDPTTLSPPSG